SMLVHVIFVYTPASLGIWLFYIQHTFDDSYSENESEWSYVNAAVAGSSYYELPPVLQWLIGPIGSHHVHHPAPSVPNYNLEEAHVQTPPLKNVTTITMKTSLDSLRYRLYDPDNQLFITFGEFKRRKQKQNTKPNKLPLKPARTNIQSK